VEELTGLEHRLRAAAGVGEWLDLSEEPDKVLRAERLHAILTEDCASAGLPAVKVRGAFVVGSLDLEAATLRRPLHLANCEVREPMILNEAIAPAIRLRACRLSQLSADQLQTRGDLDLSASRITGEVGLVGANIGGRLSFEGATMANEGGAALSADGLQVHGPMFCRAAGKRRFIATGEIRLLGARIYGQLDLGGAELTNLTGPALSADGLKVDGGMFCRAAGEHPFTATGETRLVSAHIGVVDFEGATLTNQGGPALTADGLKVDGGMFFRAAGEHPFTATGETRLVSAHIGGQLSFEGATLTNDGGAALSADALKVDGGMLCRAAGEYPFTATGQIRMPGAHVGMLDFDGATLTNLAGRALSADRLKVDGNMSCRSVGEYRFTARGEIRLPGAHVGGELSFDGAALTSDAGGRALNANRLQVETGMFCRAKGRHPFTATGEIHLVNAHIGMQLSFDGAALRKSPTAVNLQQAQVESLWLTFAERPDGVVDLRRVQTGSIDDRAYGARRTWPTTRLDGCSYLRLEASPPVDFETRLRWIRNDPDGYSPQPYEQLRDVFDVLDTRRTPGMWRLLNSVTDERGSRGQHESGATSWMPWSDTATGHGGLCSLWSQLSA
jgi:hypothetical protein